MDFGNQVKDCRASSNMFCFSSSALLSVAESREPEKTI